MRVAIAMLVLSVGSLVLGGHPVNMNVSKVRAYYLGWEVMTRASMSIDDVIRTKRIFYEISDPSLAREFTEWLDLSKLKPRNSSIPADARLVIELIDGHGGVSVFYADKEALYSGDSTSSREIDREFRERFDLVR